MSCILRMPFQTIMSFVHSALLLFGFLLSVDFQTAKTHLLLLVTFSLIVAYLWLIRSMSCKCV